MNTRAPREPTIWPDVDCIEQYQGLLERYEYHRTVADDGARRAFRLGGWLALLIPIGAALLTVLSGFTGSLPKYLVPACGFLLTVMAVVNSTLKPGERYPGLSEQLMALDDWKLDLDIRIKQVDAGDRDKAFELLRRKSGELSVIGKQIVLGITLPLWPTRSSEKTLADVDEQIK